MVEQIGEPNGIWGSGVAYPYYELSNGKFVICNFWLYDWLIWIKVGTIKDYDYELLPTKLPPKSHEDKENEISNAKKTEINAVLSILGNYYDSIKYDEPLGDYSKEKLDKFTNEDIEINISYYYGEYKNTPHETLFQIFEIYKESKQIYFGFKWWVVYWILEEDGYMLGNQEEIINTINEDNDLIEIKLEQEEFSNSIIEYMSKKREIKKSEDAWVEFWGRDEDGKYMCFYITSPIKREDGIDAKSKGVSYYYVTIDTVDDKAEKIHIKKLKLDNLFFP